MAEQSEVTSSAFDRLQKLYELLGYQDEIIWDSYKPGDTLELKKKVKLAVGVAEKPIIPENSSATKEEVQKAEKEMKDYERNMELVDKICQSMWRQAKYTGGKLVMAISFVCTVKEDVFPLPIAHLNTEFETTPIFRIQKCINMDELSARNCCMIFVDVHARVYENWEAYCKENLLPECIVVAPRKGIFMGSTNENGEWEVDLEKFLSPAAQPTGRYAKYMDNTSVGLGIGASTILVGAMFAPVLAPAAGAAAIAGAVSGAWSILRSGQNLADRSQHDQSINVTDREARSSWLGVAAGSLGFASGAAGKVLSSMATSGRTISPFLKITVNTLNVSTLIISGAGTVNGFIDVIFINDDQKISALEVVQLSASLFIFTHSVYNFQTANSIVKNHRDMTLKDMRDKLSVKQRRAFDKMAKETIRLNGESKGKADIIRSLRKVPDQKAYFRDVQKINKDLNSANVKISFGGDSQPLLNGQPANAMPNEMRANLKAAPPLKVFEGIASHDPNLGAQQPGKLNLTSNNNPVIWINTAVSVLGSLPHLIGKDTKETLLNIAQLLNEQLFKKFVMFVRNFVDEFGRDIERWTRRAISLPEYIETIFRFIEEIAKDLEISVSEFIEDLRDGENQNLLLKREIKRYYTSEYYPEPNKDCSICKGRYYEPSP